MTTSIQAYYMGRNSIADDGKLYYGIGDCPEINDAVLERNYREGVRDIKAELKLSADVEWD